MKCAPKGKLKITNETNSFDVQSQTQCTNNLQLNSEPYINTLHQLKENQTHNTKEIENTKHTKYDIIVDQK